MISEGPFRSWLFAPGNHPRRVEKALSLDADVVILDLEDAVAVAEKSATREIAVTALQGRRSGLGYIRVNAYDTSFCYDDICTVITKGVDGIILPKVETAEQIKSIDWLVCQLERNAGLPVGRIDIMPIIETGLGVANVQVIAAANSRIRRLSFGAGDYSKDMRLNWSLDESEISHARAEIALASRAAGLEPPVDTVWVHVNDVEGCKRSAERVRDMGYQGKLCIHPNQIEPVNTAFTPSDEEIMFSKKIIAAFDEAEASGLASIQVDGYFVDYPIVDQARRTLTMIKTIENKST